MAAATRRRQQALGMTRSTNTSSQRARSSGISVGLVVAPGPQLVTLLLALVLLLGSTRVSTGTAAGGAAAIVQPSYNQHLSR